MSGKKTAHVDRNVDLSRRDEGSIFRTAARYGALKGSLFIDKAVASLKFISWTNAGKRRAQIMKLIDVDFQAGTTAVQAQIEFTYDPSGSPTRRWTNILSLKKSDQEASFAFRVNEAENFFQLFFGDGAFVRGKVRIEADGFQGKRCRLSYTRTSDFTLVRLSSGELKRARFVMHKGAVASRVPVEHYTEGQPREGIKVHSTEFGIIDADNFPLTAVELELASESEDCNNRHYIRSWSALAAAYFRERQYSRALPLFRKAYHRDPSKINFVAFSKARSCISALYSRKEKPGVWRSFSSPGDAVFGRAREAALGQDIQGSIRIFADGVERILGAPPYSYSEQHRKRICTAFSHLVGGFDDKVAPYMPEAKSIRKIIVSGMGWSGSGAVYDYLKEFDGIEAIPGETPYIEGASSLQTIYASLDDDRKFKQRVLDFFFCALIGHGYFRNDNDFKLFKNARTMLASPEHENYLSSIEGWCALASAMCAVGGQARRDRFSTLADYTIDHFSIGREIPAGKIVLLDNVVHIGNVAACIPFLGNTTLFCVFRDPRSNYVALVREASSFNFDVHTYVQQRKKRLSLCIRAAEDAATLADRCLGRKVEIIRFEEFVLSENFRTEMAMRLGLDPSSQERFSHFKPWESIRNVVLHQEHPEQDEVELIAEELREYCVEPGIRPLNENNQL